MRGHGLVSACYCQDRSRDSLRLATAKNGCDAGSELHFGAETGVTVRNVAGPAVKRDEPMAVAEGFEPSVDFHPQTLSRRSP